MKISILLILGVAAIHLPRIEGNQNDSGDALHWNSTRFRRSNLANGRFRKDSGDDALKTSVSNLQMIARITNAIYLQQGLISGSIPPDALISELLHFGSVKPSDISTIDTAKIQTAVNSLKDLPAKLKPDANALKVETSLDVLEAFLSEIRGLNFGKWDSTKFKAEIGRLEKMTVDKTEVSAMSKATADWKANHNKPYDGRNMAGAKHYMVDLAENLQAIKAGASKMKANYWTFKEFNSAADGLSPLIQAQKGVKKLLNSIQNVVVSKTEADSYTAYIDSIPSSLSSVAQVQPSMEVFRTVVSPVANRQQNVQFTFGLPDGSSDFSKIPNDLKNSWVQKLVQSSTFSISLDKLMELDGPLQNIHNSLKSNDVKDRAAQLVNVLDDVHQLIARSDETKAGIALTHTCAPTLKTLGADVLTPLAGHLKSIDEKLAEMSTNTEAINQYFSKHPEIATWCDDVIKFCQDSQTANDIKKVVDDYKSYKNLGALNTHIAEIQKLADKVVNAPTEIIAETQTVKGKFAEMDAYQKELNQFSTYFNCLQKDALFSVFDTVRTIKTFRSKDSSHGTAMDDGMEAVKKVAGTKDALMKLETSITAQKGFKSKETDELELLKDASTHSKTIGLAVQGVTNMKDALEKRTDLEGILKSKDVIQKHRKTLRYPEDQNSLNSLLALIDEVQKMFTSLDTFKKSVTPSTSTTLADYSGIFQKAKSVSGSSGEFHKIAVTVGKLKESVTDNDEKKSLEDVETSLKRMDSMGLDFVRYHNSFDGSGGTLSVLDDFFASFANHMMQIAAKEEEDNKLGLIIGIVGGLISLIAIIILLFWIYRRRRYLLFFLKVPSDLSCLLKILRHFLKALEDYANANKTFLTKEEIAEGAKTYARFFSEMFTTHNGICLADETKCNSLSLTETLLNEPLLNKTRVKLRGYGKRFRNDFYHASYLKLLNGRKWILCQTPLHGLKELNKVSTVEKFWWMVGQEKSKRVFMLNPLKYDNINYSEYFPLEEGGVKEFSDIRVECVKLITVKETDADYDHKNQFQRHLQVRELQVIIGQAKPFTVTHYWTPWWVTGSIPDYPCMVADLVRLILESKDSSPPIIHCGDGLTESGIIGFVGYCVTMIRVYGKIDFGESLEKVRGYRAGTLRTKWAYAFAAFVLIEFFEHDHRDAKDHKEILAKSTFMSSCFIKMMAPARVINPSAEEKSEKKKSEKKGQDNKKQDVKSLKKAKSLTATAKPGELQKTKNGEDSLATAEPDEDVPKTMPKCLVRPRDDLELMQAEKENAELPPVAKTSQDTVIDIEKLESLSIKENTPEQDRMEKANMKRLRKQKKIKTRAEWAIDEEERVERLKTAKPQGQ